MKKLKERGLGLRFCRRRWQRKDDVAGPRIASPQFLEQGRIVSRFIKIQRKGMLAGLAECGTGRNGYDPAMSLKTTMNRSEHPVLAFGQDDPMVILASAF
jgi:hypothetical protein